MNLHTLSPHPKAVKKRKRIGRGQGSGKGGTSTKGHKGAQARTGYKTKPNFEGGQTPLQRRLPKGGFKNPTRVEYRVFNLPDLERIATATGTHVINSDLLVQCGEIKAGERYKVLAKGSCTMGLHVTAHAFSAQARQAIEANQGTTTID